MPSRGTRVAVTLALFASAGALPFALGQQTSPATPTETGGPVELQIDAPSRIVSGEQFPLLVTYSVPTDSTGAPVEKRPVHIMADNTGDVHYDPPVFDLIPNKTETVSTVVDHTDSGLAELLIGSDRYPNVKMTVDAGFRGRLDWRDLHPMESGTSHWVTLSFMDNVDRPLALDAPIKMRITASNANIRPRGSGPWSDHVDLSLPKGAGDTGALEVEPTTLSGSPGTLQARAFLNDDNEVLFDRVISFEILPPVWVRIGITILGALIYTLYALSKTLTGPLLPAIGKAVASGIFAGVLAWAIADWNVLGIKIDTARLTGYFVLGLLTSYAGVEPVLARFVARASSRQPEREESSSPLDTALRKP